MASSGVRRLEQARLAEKRFPLGGGGVRSGSSFTPRSSRSTTPAIRPPRISGFPSTEMFKVAS